MRALIAAASFALSAGVASASPIYMEPMSIQNGSTLDFSTVEVGSSKALSVVFGLGEGGRDESVNWIIGPTFNLISGALDVFSFDAVQCSEVGIGLECYADVVFTPNSLGDLLSKFSISAIINFTEIHGQEDGEVYEYSDEFSVNLRGTGVAAVPLPASAAVYFAALGLLGWVGRRRKENGGTLGQPA